jgi:hypothetical protein
MKTLFLLLFLCVSSSYAFEIPPHVRIYNENGEFVGKIEKRPHGTMRIYDAKGNFRGTIEQRPYNQNRLYDEKGQFKNIIKTSP